MPNNVFKTSTIANDLKAIQTQQAPQQIADAPIQMGGGDSDGLPMLAANAAPPVVQPGTVLHGNVEQNVNLPFLGKSAALGLGTAVELPLNFALGLGSDIGNVPQDQRFSFEDIMRAVTGNKEFQSPQAQIDSPEYQQQLHSSPANTVGGMGAQFAGGFLAPTAVGPGAIRGMATLASKLPLAAQVGKVAGPAMQQIGNIANKLPFVSKLPAPVKGSAAFGAALAPMNAAGLQYTNEGKITDPAAIAASVPFGAAFGGATGAAVHGAGKLLSRMMSGRGAQPQAQAAPPQEAPSNPMSLFGSVTGGVQPQQILAQLNTMSDDLLARVAKGTMTRDKATAIANKMFAGARQNTTDADAQTAIAQAQSRFANMHRQGVEKDAGKAAQAANKADDRAYRAKEDHRKMTMRNAETQRKEANRRSETQRKEGNRAKETARKELNRKFDSANKDAKREGVKHAKIEKSNEHFDKIVSEIDSAKTKEHLVDLERQIHTSPTGKGGERLLTSDQRGQLMREVRRRRRELKVKPGESKGSPKGGKATPKPKAPSEKLTGAERDAEERRLFPKSFQTFNEHGTDNEKLGVKHYGTQSTQAQGGTGGWEGVDTKQSFGAWSPEKLTKEQVELALEGYKGKKLAPNSHEQREYQGLKQQLEKLNWRDNNKRDVNDFVNMGRSALDGLEDILPIESEAYAKAMEILAQRAETSPLVQGVMRKSMDSAIMPREQRHTIALSAEKWADLAGLSAKHKEALQDWTQRLSEEHADKKITEKKLQELAEWALKNRDKWAAQEADFMAGGPENELNLVKKATLENLFFRAKVDEVLSKETSFELNAMRNELLETGFNMKTRTIKGKPVKVGLLGKDAKPLMKDGKPVYGVARDKVKDGELPDLPRDESRQTIKKEFSATVGGVAKKHSVGADGTLNIEKMDPIPGGNPEVKSLADLWDRAQFLRGRLKTLEESIAEIREETLDDGESFASVMRKVFDSQKALQAAENDAAKVPSVNIHHVDESGNVVTLRYEQNQVKHNFNEATRDLELQYKAAQAQAKAEAAAAGRTKTTYGVSTRSINAITGLEPIALGMALATTKIGGKVGGILGRAKDAEALFHVGTIRDLIKSHPEFGGDQIVHMLDEMQGDLFRSFLKHSDSLAKVSSSDDLVEIMNKYKPTKNINEIIKYPKGASETEIRERNTAFLMRQAYKNLADKLDPVLDAMKVRRQHAKQGFELSPESVSAAKYRPEDFQDGKIKSTVYSSGFHEALQRLSDGLRLKPQEKDTLSMVLGSMVSRKNQSFFVGNIKTAGTNFLDNAPITIAEYGMDWLRAGIKLGISKNVREGVRKLPLIPQSDLEFTRMKESLLNRPAPVGKVQKFLYAVDEWNVKLTQALDKKNIGGKVLGLADKYYSRQATVASVYKVGRELRGKDGAEKFVDDFFGGNLPEHLEKQAAKRVVSDLSRLYNSAMPNLNRDLLAESALGGSVAQYSKPVRRVQRQMYDWMQGAMKGNMSDLQKLAVSGAMYIGMGGRAVIPQSVRNILLYTASLGGGAYAMEQMFQALDEKNVLKNQLHWDVSDRIGFDSINIASPALDDLFGAVGRAHKAHQSGSSPLEAITGGLLALQTGLVLMPRIGMVGTGYLNSLRKNLGYAAQGGRPVVIKLAGHSQTVQIPYNVKDAIREWVIAGPTEQTQKVAPVVQSNIAKRLDIKVPRPGPVPANRPSPNFFLSPTKGVKPSNVEM